MRIDGRVFRGVLDVLALWSRTGALLHRSNYCRLSDGEGDVLRIEFPTTGGWLVLEVPGEPEGLEGVQGIDLTLLMKVLKAASWPRTGEVGQVELAFGVSELVVLVPRWKQAAKGWVEQPPTRFVFPRVDGQGLFLEAEKLPTVPELTVGRSFALEAASLEAAITGAACCVSTDKGKGVLQAVELVCRPDEVLGVSTDGTVAAVASEPAAVAVEEQVSIPLPPDVMRAALSIWKKLQLQGDVLISMASVEGATTPLVELRPAAEGSAFRLVLKVPQGHVPLDAVQQVVSQTGVEMGRVDARETLLKQLEIAELNREARVAWLVWEAGVLRVCSHSLWLDQNCPLKLSSATGGDAELGVDVLRLHHALDQLKASGGTGPITLAIDNVTRPSRLMLRQTNPATSQVRTVVVMGVAGSSYQDQRMRSQEQTEQWLDEGRKHRRREQYRTPIPA